MSNKNDIFYNEKQENKKRILMSVICVVLVAVICVCVYLLVFYKKTDVENSDASNESSGITESISGELSIPPSSSEEPSVPDEQSDDPVSLPAESSDISEPSAASQTSSEESSEPDTTEYDHQWHGYVYRYFTAAFEDFTPPATVKQSYISTVNAFYKAIGTNSNFYHMIIPTSVEFAKASFPKEVISDSGDSFFNQSQKSFLELVYGSTDQAIKNINVLETYWEKYNNDEYLFFRTDKNYTALAAYYAYAEFCKGAGLTPVSIDELTEKKLDKFLGTFYTQTASETLFENPDYFKFYDLDAAFPSKVTIYKGSAIFKNQKMTYSEVSSIHNCYNIFFGQEAYRIEIETENTSNRSILVVGDSSACPVVPFLSANYSKITFINAIHFNPDYYPLLTEFVKTNSYDDILLMDYSTSYKSPFYFAANLRAMIGAEQ